ncbi:MAG: hypothetical protein HY667_01325 [Chloroflexi bacterium]|nr:hypothetical protein [Chloroflexota bacterium]
MTYYVKKLDDASLAKLQELERKSGCCIIAFERWPKLATMSDDQLRALRFLENEMGAILLAYSCQ